MLKQTIKFTDFNGVERTKDLYFHVSKANILTASDDSYSEIMRLGEQLKERGLLLEQTGSEFDEKDPFNPKTQLVAESARMVGRLLDKLIDLSYGERSEDGSAFNKSSEVLVRFKQSAAYDSFVEQMLTNQDDMLKFIQRLLDR